MAFTSVKAGRSLRSLSGTLARLARSLWVASALRASLSVLGNDATSCVAPGPMDWALDSGSKKIENKDRTGGYDGLMHTVRSVKSVAIRVLPGLPCEESCWVAARFLACGFQSLSEIGAPCVPRALTIG